MTKNVDDQQLQVAHLASADFLLFVELAFANLYPGQVLATNWLSRSLPNSPGGSLVATCGSS